MGRNVGVLASWNWLRMRYLQPRQMSDMDPDKKLFIRQAAASARMVAHPFPEMAASEAALESAYGKSLLAIKYNNLFGMKQHKHPTYGTISLPTREFENGAWVITNAEFVSYPTQEDCFADRLATLTRLASVYPNYKMALAATMPEDYIIHVSATWSTDPNRWIKVQTIYNEYMADQEQNA
jgi:flagellum-specific peptidoglycan hydrolase FlgJ